MSLFLNHNKNINTSSEISEGTHSNKLTTKIWGTAIWPTIIIIAVVADNLYEVFMLYSYYLLVMFIVYINYKKYSAK